MKLVPLMWILAIFTFLALTGCSVVHRNPPNTPIPLSTAKLTPHQADQLRFEARITNLLAALQPAEKEFNDKSIKEELKPAYTNAAGHYNLARKLWMDYKSALSLGLNDGYTKKRLEVELVNAEIAVAQLSSARGIKS
jgi:hypothetical protein